MNQCQYQAISETNRMTGKKVRIQCFKFRKGVQNVTCDSCVAPIPSCPSSVDSFIPTFTRCTWFPELLHILSLTSSLSLCHSHFTCSSASRRPLNFDPFSLNLALRLYLQQTHTLGSLINHFCCAAEHCWRQIMQFGIFTILHVAASEYLSELPP